MSETASLKAVPMARGGWPLLGHFVPLRRTPLQFMDSLREYGDLVRIKIGPIRFVVVCDPVLAHQVIADLRTYDRTGQLYDRVRRVMGNGVVSAVHADHRRQRLIMQPAFHSGHLPGYAEVMRQQTASMLEGWHEGDVVDMVDEMFRLTMSITLGALFSTGLDAVESAKLREAFEVFLRGTITQIALQKANRLPLPANRRYHAALRQWRTQVRGLIERYRSTGGEEQDLMARLLGARYDDGEGLTDQELSDQVAVLLIAGAETTSAVLTWATYLLCTNPEALDAVNAEVDRVLGGEIASWEQLPELELTARVILETMRVYPPSWLIPRTATRETQLGGRVIPVGTTLLVSEYVLHHDPSVFPEPDRFDPDRWTAHGQSASPVARRAYMPFGAGQTKCLGEHFAIAEATIALASILAQWTPELRVPRKALKPDTRVVLLPRCLPVRLTRRSRPA